jgi:hypothetical protein
MAESTWPTVSASVNVSDVGTFIPELWSDEVVAAYKSNLVMANLISRMNHNGRKGDTVHIPAPYRGDANAKASETGVIIQSFAETEVSISINKHWEYSRLIEDIASVQALGAARMFYTDDAGYSLARRTDRDIWLQTHYLNAGNTTPAAANLFETAVIGSDGSTAFSGAANTNTGNGAALTDVGIRQVIASMDDNDTPMQDRYLVIPPIEKKSLTGIPRFTEQAFVGEAGGSNTIRNGLIGDLYGVKVYVSSNCPWVHVNNQTGTQSVTFSSAAPTGASYSDEYGVSVDWDTSSPTDTKYRVCAMFHKSALVIVEQMGVRMQTQYKQEFLADLMTADTIYGVGRLRDGNVANTSTAGYAIVVPSS